MKLKTSQLLIILIILAALVVVIKWNEKRKSTGTLKTEFFTLNFDQINKFTIKPEFDPKKGYDVVKENNKWFVVNNTGFKYEADEDFVNRAFSELKKLKPSRLASTSRDDFPQYGVDSVGTLLSIFDDKGQHDIILGSMSFQNQSQVITYCRLPEEDETYAAESYMEGTFKAGINAWRKRTILPPMAQWNSLDFAFPNLTPISLTKKENQWYLGEKAADSAVAAELVNALNRLSSLGFADDEQTLMAKSPYLTLNINARDTLQRADINFYQMDKKWLIKSSLNEGNYFIADSARPLWTNLDILKSSEE